MITPMTDLEAQLRRLRFRSPSAAARDYILSPAPATVSARRWPLNPWLSAALAGVWLVIALLHCHTPEVTAPAGPRLTCAELQTITLTLQLQYAMLQREGRLLDLDGPAFSAPRHL